MSTLVANSATGINIYDATMVNTNSFNPTVDMSANVGTGDLSFNAPMQQYMMLQNNITTPNAATGNGISFSGWFFPTGSQSSGSTIIDISGTNGVTCALYYYNANNTLAGFFNGVAMNSTATITPGVWHFFTYTIACTIQGLALQTLYVDSATNPIATSKSAIYTPFSVGTSFGGTFAYIGYGQVSGSFLTSIPSLTYFNGRVDDFRFYNRVLSPPEISVLYRYNYRANAQPTIIIQASYSIAYLNAVQIDISGTFSGLYVTRTTPSTGAIVTSQVSCAQLTYVNSSSWAYIDTTVSSDTTYTYSLQPYLKNTVGSAITLGIVTTTPLTNASFSNGLLVPITGKSAPATPFNLPGWTITSTGSTNTVVSLCNGSVPGISASIPLPSTVNFFLDVSQNTSGAVTTIQQSVGLYSGSQCYISFFAWPKDGTYSTLQTLAVTLDCMTLLNNYTFSSTSVVAFNLPFSMSMVGSFPLTFIVRNNGATTASGINIGGIQIRSQSEAGVGYRAVDPSLQILYYPFDSNTISGTTVYNCAAGRYPSVADASLNGTAVLSTSLVPPLLGGNSLVLDGSSGYVTVAPWTLPAKVAGSGFSICGWFYPLTGTPANSVVAWFGNGGSGGDIKIFLNQGAVDFSMGYVEVLSTTAAITYTANAWNFFAVTGVYGTDVSSTYTFYLNAIQLTTANGAWINPSYTTNWLGGYPTSVLGTTSLGYLSGGIDEFRVYNRALTAQEVATLWTFGSTATNLYMNLIDPTGMDIYYPMDQTTQFVNTGYVTAPSFSGISATGATITCTGSFFNVYVTYTGGTAIPGSGFSLAGTDLATRTITGMNPNTLYTFTNYLMNGATVLYPIYATSTVCTLGSANTPVITAISDTSVTVSCSGAFSSARVTCSGGPVNEGVSQTISTANAFSVVYTGLTPNTPYTFTLYPINANNVESLISASTTVTTMAKIYGVLSSNTTTGATTLDCSGVFSKCIVTYNGGTITSTTSPYTVTTANAFTLSYSGMSANTTYIFTFIPVNSSDVSYATSAIMTQVVTLATNNTPTLSDVAATGLTLACTGAFSSCMVVYNGTAATPTSGTTVVGTNTIKQTYTAMAPNTLYSFLVYPVNAGGIQSTSATSASTTTWGSSGIPTFSSVTTTGAMLACTGKFKNCVVYFTGGSASPASGSTITGTSTSITQTYTSMSANTAYTFSVYPNNSANVTSTLPSSGTVVTLGSISTLSNTSVTANSATISCIGKFTKCNLTLSSGAKATVANADNFTYTFTGLFANTSYTVSGEPVNSAGITGTSAASSVFVTWGTISTANVTVNSSSSVTLQCTGVFNKCYVIWSGAAFYMTGTSTYASQTLSNLSANTTYTFFIYAVNSANVKSDTSTSTSGTTYANPFPFLFF